MPARGARKPLIPRFWAKVLKTDFCWLWLGEKTPAGYGLLATGARKTRKRILVHRLSYELFNGPIPKGLVLDHTCLTPACVRPAHLEAVTPRENTLRGISPMAINSRQTHCQRGHLLEDENLYFYRRKTNRMKRICRICAYERTRAWRRRQKVLGVI